MSTEVHGGPLTAGDEAVAKPGCHINGAIFAIRDVQIFDPWKEMGVLGTGFVDIHERERVRRFHATYLTIGPSKLLAQLLRQVFEKYSAGNM